MKQSVTLALAVVLAISGSAQALVITVTSPLDTDGRVASRSFSQQNGIEATFAFNPNEYDVTDPFTSSSIRFSEVTVTYGVSEANVAFQVGGNLGIWDRESREYITSFVVNGTDYLNFTTWYGRGTGVFGAFGWSVCTSFTYTKNAVEYEITPDEFGGECERNFFGGSPNQVRHTLKFGRLLNTSDSQFAILFGDDETRGQAFILNADDEIGAPDSVVAKNITSYTVSTRNVAEDASETRISWFFTTFANHDNATNQANEANQQCRKFFGLLPCNSLDQVIGWIFGFIHNALGFVFGFFPGGERVAEFMATLVGIVIAVPIHAIALLLVAPGKTIVFFHWYFAMIGVMRYALSSTADFSVIWETPLKIDVAIFKGIKGFAVFMYDLVVKIAGMISSLVPG